MTLTRPAEREKGPEVAFCDPHGRHQSDVNELTAFDPAANGPPAHAESFRYLS